MKNMGEVNLVLGMTSIHHYNEPMSIITKGKNVQDTLARFQNMDSKRWTPDPRTRQRLDRSCPTSSTRISYYFEAHRASTSLKPSLDRCVAWLSVLVTSSIYRPIISQGPEASLRGCA